MARDRSSTRKPRDGKLFLGKGITALAIGAGFLLGPALVGGSAVAQELGQALRTPGLLALGVGAVLVALHLLLGRNPRDPGIHVRKPSFDPESSNVINFPTSPHLFAVPPPPTTASTQRSRPVRWGLDVFDAIEWRRFEAVCESLFAQAGFKAKTQSHGADGGIDIWLYSQYVDGPATVVQCKHWRGPVRVKEMREFFGVMASHNLKRGTYATTSTYTPDALRFAKDNGISALDGTALLALIARRTPEQQQALLDVAYEGDYWRPTCASCGLKMVERERKGDRSRFWGCSNYPRCHSKLNMRSSA